MYSLRLREMVVNAKRTPVCWGDPFLTLPPPRTRAGYYLATAVTTAQRLMHAIVAARPTELLRFWWTPGRRIQTSHYEPTLIHTYIYYTCLVIRPCNRQPPRRHPPSFPDNLIAAVLSYDRMIDSKRGEVKE